MRAAFVINARQKQDYVARSVRGALEQTYPCEVVLSDQCSTDQTLQIMRDTVDSFGPTHHTVKIVQCPIDLPFSMEAANRHMDWLWQQTSPECDWIFQASADDYSLPDRVKICMEAVDANPCSAVACTMFFEKPGETNRQSVSGYPRESGYIKAGEGLMRLAYGSTIGGYSREFLAKYAALAGKHTPDVLWGWLAALDKGFYVVSNPQHVHCEVASLTNMGFQGKLRAATGEDALRVAELNHFQLCNLYDRCATLAQEFHPDGVPADDWSAVIQMVLGQTGAWLRAREVLHEHGLTPGVL